MKKIYCVDYTGIIRGKAYYEVSEGEVPNIDGSAPIEWGFDVIEGITDWDTGCSFDPNDFPEEPTQEELTEELTEAFQEIPRVEQDNDEFPI